MSPNQILEMIAINREYIKLKSPAALHNLPMLHRSFGRVKDDRIAISLALNDSFAAAIYTSDYARAIEISKRTLSKYKNSSEVYLSASHEAVIGRCYTYLLRPDQAEQHLRRAEKMAAEIDDPSEATRELRADILHKLAMNMLHGHGDKTQMATYLRGAISILADTKLHSRLGICVMSLGTALYVERKYEAALTEYLRAESLLSGAEDHSAYSNLLCTTGMCYIEMKQYDLAESYIRRGLEIRTSKGSYGEIAAAYYHLYLLYRAQGHSDQAYETLMLSLDYARIGQALGLQYQIIDGMEEIAVERGDKIAMEKHRDQRQALISTTT